MQSLTFSLLIAPSGQQEPHLTIEEQPESCWQFFDELGIITSCAVARSATTVAISMTAIRRAGFFCIDPSCTNRMLVSSSARFTSDHQSARSHIFALVVVSRVAGTAFDFFTGSDTQSSSGEKRTAR
jgi:hypothetical protein